ncbi:hypothetical protein LTR08_007641 [Meristemomyces frigidus]|nr:hypothetical protein LTR08_007641 [Meristemomyces frigidus]
MSQTLPPAPQTYRPALPLPTRHLHQATVCFEEELYPQAFTLFDSALLAGQATASSSHVLPAHVPPVQYLAVAATLSVHPSLTTRTRDPERHRAADAAFAYLSHVRSVVGVRHAGLDKALQFTPKAPTVVRSQRGAKGNASRHSELFGAGDDDGDGDSLSSTKLRSGLAGKDALWTNAEDFWSVVGWAFNCSVAHPHRWARWKLWLAFMLDVLDSDLAAHTAEQTAERSLIAGYLRPIGQGRNSKRRLMRAVLADGGAKSVGEFGEVWRGETKMAKAEKKGEGRAGGKKRKLDLENGEFGDYFDEDSDVGSSAVSLAPRSRSASAFPTTRGGRQQTSAPDLSADENDSEADHKPNSKATSQPSSVSSFGGLESITLRQRLLALFTRLSALCPQTFLDIEDLFDLFTESLRPLPLPIFQQLILPAKRWLGANEQCSLDQMLLRPLLASAAPTYNANALTQVEFETHYAPFAANSASAGDNAKVALLVEDLLVLLWREGALGYSGRLRTVVEDGVQARREKCASDGRRKTGLRALEDEEAARVMEGAGARMGGCLDLVE